MLTKAHGGGLVIVNLQSTQLDPHADVRIFSYVDDIMRMLMERLEIPIPTYDEAKDFIRMKQTLRFDRRTFVAVEPRPFDGSSRVKKPPKKRTSRKSPQKKRKQEDKAGDPNENHQTSQRLDGVVSDGADQSQEAPPRKKIKME